MTGLLVTISHRLEARLPTTQKVPASSARDAVAMTPMAMLASMMRFIAVLLEKANDEDQPTPMVPWGQITLGAVVNGGGLDLPPVEVKARAKSLPSAPGAA